MSLLDDLQSMEPVQVEKILEQLLDSKDVELKSEVHNPIALSKLKALAIALEICKLKNSSKVIDKFIEWYLKYMVSYKRQSRKEAVNAIARMLEERETTITHRMLGKQ